MLPKRKAAQSTPTLAIFGTFGDLTNMSKYTKFSFDGSRGFRLEDTCKSHAHTGTKSSITLRFPLPSPHLITNYCSHYTRHN